MDVEELAEEFSDGIEKPNPHTARLYRKKRGLEGLMAKNVLLDEIYRKSYACTFRDTWFSPRHIKAGPTSPNGALIEEAERAGFDVLVTADQGVNYQQNMQGRSLSLAVPSTTVTR